MGQRNVLVRLGGVRSVLGVEKPSEWLLLGANVNEACGWPCGLGWVDLALGMMEITLLEPSAENGKV